MYIAVYCSNVSFGIFNTVVRSVLVEGTETWMMQVVEQGMIKKTGEKVENNFRNH